MWKKLCRDNWLTVNGSTLTTCSCNDEASKISSIQYCFCFFNISLFPLFSGMILAAYIHQARGTKGGWIKMPLLIEATGELDLNAISHSLNWPGLISSQVLLLFVWGFIVEKKGKKMTSAFEDRLNLWTSAAATWIISCPCSPDPRKPFSPFARWIESHLVFFLSLIPSRSVCRGVRLVERVHLQPHQWDRAQNDR